MACELRWGPSLQYLFFTLLRKAEVCVFELTFVLSKTIIIKKLIEILSLFKNRLSNVVAIKAILNKIRIGYLFFLMSSALWRVIFQKSHLQNANHIWILSLATYNLGVISCWIIFLRTNLMIFTNTSHRQTAKKIL